MSNILVCSQNTSRYMPVVRLYHTTPHIYPTVFAFNVRVRIHICRAAYHVIYICDVTLEYADAFGKTIIQPKVFNTWQLLLVSSSFRGVAWRGEKTSHPIIKNDIRNSYMSRF